MSYLILLLVTTQVPRTEATRDREWLLVRAVKTSTDYDNTAKIKKNLASLDDQEIKALARQVRSQDAMKIRGYRSSYRRQNNQLNPSYYFNQYLWQQQQEATRRIYGRRL